MASLGLLDTAAEFCGTYLSELRRGTTRQQVIPYLLQIPDDRYPLDEWNDALAYLFWGQKRYLREEVPSPRHFSANRTRERQLVLTIGLWLDVHLLRR